MPRKKEPSFEEALAELENIVSAMENSDCTLKELMDNYTAGVKLGDYCQKVLTAAEEKMDSVVSERDGKVVTEELKLEGE